MSDEFKIVDKKKSHRERHSGRKSDKKKAKKDGAAPQQDLTAKQRNPKAFAFNSAVRAERNFRRKQDINTKKQHIPLVDRTPIEPPPILIAVVGPPKVGKTTLINNIIKLFTKAPLTELKGPVTIVTGKKRRITLIECNNDINSMIDIAKVADLVLLLCDASFGFEMEVFEFLNICQVQGMPRIMGILTHLDMIKNNKTLKNTKKTLKHRFWTEVYPGAKLFYLSGILHGEYLRNEIKNLGRFISVMKFRPLTWRSTHSYLLGDRYEDLTNLELVRKNPKCDRNVSLYGYIRGVPLNKNTSVHVAGLGDLKLHDISYLPDPCPLPEEIKKRALVEKEKLIYAPFSGVGGIVYDKDAVYVELGGSHSHNKRDEMDETANMVTNLIEAKETLDVKMLHSQMQLFTGSKKLKGDDFDNGEEEVDVIDSLYEKSEGKVVDDLNAELKELRGMKEFGEEVVLDGGRERRKVVFAESDDELIKRVSDNEDTDDSDSELDINDSRALNKEEYVRLKVNKDEEVHDRITQELNRLSTTNQSKSNKRIVFDDDDDISDNHDESDDESVLKNPADPNEDSDETYNDVSPVQDDSNGDDNEEDFGLKWKDNIAKKAEEAFLDRQKCTKNLMKLVYGVFDSNYLKEENPVDANESEELGGLFKVASRDQQKLRIEKDQMDLQESPLFMPWNANIRNWLENENKPLILNCFVTGKWKESEDADELLKLDNMGELSDDNSEVFGDFEDLETGEKFEKSGTKRKNEEVEENKTDRDKLAEKKRKLKEKFDAAYDEDDKEGYYEDLKSSAEKQALLNRSVFENMPDDLRVQIEGYRAGMYVRMEFRDVPCEFIDNFDPTYPLVIGVLNMGEENVGFVNVKIKKHRWYKKILKANDPLIISMGWRRFQTLPLYSKLEDDMKFRYLKYTPEHITCNAHFWGPITPQGTGFLALQTCDGTPEILKKQGFRIAATGAVQELDKSTQILKKLKLIGYPMKIYKKTAFIKGMFNSALEVAKFEGARIKTVSGIRGQIKKAASKPEGVFRATFEDKIQLSDIVFCRTWYKVEPEQFYNPVMTLLLPPNEKNSWKGVRTTGEIKRDFGIQNEANKDSLYTEIKRDPKVFKPLFIPGKLQKALPYKDKPKHGIKSDDKKKKAERVAVIPEPHEQKITKMMKMIKTAYNYKQDKLKKETKERMEKYSKHIEEMETRKNNKIRQAKKAVFRKKSKSAMRQEKRADKSDDK